MRLRILVIEDNAVISMLLTETLTDMGHAVCGVASTQAGAVAAALRLTPDLLIVDARLGEDSGVAAVEQVLRSRRIAHLFISGGPIHMPQSNAVVLQKPFDDAALMRAIRRAVALHARPG